MPLSVSATAAVGLLAATLLIALLSGQDMRRLLADVPELRCAADMERFKGMARRNMRSALVMVALAVVAACVILVGFVGGSLSEEELVFLLGLGVFFSLCGRWL